MKSAYPIALGSLLVLALAAFTAEEHAARGDASFAASISGDIHTTLRGDAKYGVVNGKGDAEHPNGVFRADSGTLVVTSTGDNVIRGSFRVDATGFLAADPANEDRQIRASGGFTAFRD
jgi:hypothetical protein